MINAEPRGRDFNTRTIDARGWTWWYPDDRHDYVHPSWPWGGVAQCFAPEWSVWPLVARYHRYDVPEMNAFLRTGDNMTVVDRGGRVYMRLEYQGH